MSTATLHTTTEPDKILAASWKLLACLAFAMVNGIVRYLTGGSGASETLPYSEICFLQNVFGLVFLIPFMTNKTKLEFKSQYFHLHLIRVIFAVSGVLMWYAALKYLPIAQAVSLAFTGPIFTIIGCRLFLNEPLTKYRLMAITLSIFGAFIVTRPDRGIQGLFEGDMTLIYSLLPMASAISWVGCKMCASKLAKRGERPSVMTFYLLIGMAPISLLLIFFENWLLPTLTQTLMLAGLGILGCFAQIATARAFKLADVSFLMPFGISRLVFSGIVGFAAFAEIPKSLNMWVGTTVILMSIFLLRKDAKMVDL